jgi:topoisomerase-4 subunit A
LLIFPVGELPVLSKGKGNKIIQIPPKRAAAGKELLVCCKALPTDAVLTVHAGKRHLSLKPGQFEAYFGLRGRRGKRLPRGFRSVSHLEVTVPRQMSLTSGDNDA